jgi:molybdopterin/thiamine biosynthesis adenylyltransferase
MLTDSELSRYSRQIMLFGREGQERLKNATVFIAGAGGLGSIVAIYMAAAGFGRIRIADCDTVDVSNLNRQVLHGTGDVGRDKTESALQTLQEINPEIDVQARQEKIDEDSLKELLEGTDLIMDAMDNFETRYLLNQAALKRRIPLFHGAISGFHGQATTVVPGKSACLCCLFPRAPPPSTFPALGSTCGVIGSIQVNEALKFVLGRGELLTNRLLLWDGLNSCMDELACERRSACEHCREY